jgi:small subunit ribosomal protein S20
VPQHKSCEKRIRQNKKQNPYNRAVRSVLKTSTKKFHATEGEDLEKAFREAVSELDRAAKKGVIPKQRADRKKSRLALAMNRKRAAAESRALP